MFAGLTVSNVLSVPAGAFIGPHWEWRASFLGRGDLRRDGLAGVAKLLPRQPQRTDRHAGGAGGADARKRRQYLGFQRRQQRWGHGWEEWSSPPAMATSASNPAPGELVNPPFIIGVIQAYPHREPRRCTKRHGGSSIGPPYAALRADCRSMRDRVQFPTFGLKVVVVLREKHSQPLAPHSLEVEIYRRK